MRNLLLLASGAYLLNKYKEKNDCPASTQSVKLNTKNRQRAIEEYQYGPPNPALPSVWYWTAYAKKWLMGNEPTAQQIEEFKTMRCWNCAAFDISPRMMKCLPPVSEADNYDLSGETENTVFGYCHMHNFKCRSERTCYTWAGGGPIVNDEASKAWQG